MIQNLKCLLPETTWLRLQIAKLWFTNMPFYRLREPVANFAQEYWSWSKCAEEYYQIFEALKT